MNVILVVALSTSGLGITAVVEVTTSVEVPFSSLRGVVVVFSSSGTVVDGGMSTTSVEVPFSSLRGAVVVFSSSGTVVDGVASVIFAVVSLLLYGAEFAAFVSCVDGVYACISS